MAKGIGAHIETPAGTTALSLGEGSVNGVSATTLGHVYTYSDGNTGLEANGTLWIQANGAGGLICAQGVALGATGGSMVQSAGGGVAIYAGAPMGANLGSPDGPGGPPSMPTPPCAGVEDSVNKGMAINFIAKGVAGFATGSGAWEKAKAAWDIAKGAGIGTMAYTHNHELKEGIESTINAADNAMATAESIQSGSLIGVPGALQTGYSTAQAGDGAVHTFKEIHEEHEREEAEEREREEAEAEEEEPEGEGEGDAEGDDEEPNQCGPDGDPEEPPPADAGDALADGTKGAGQGDASGAAQGSGVGTDAAAGKIVGKAPAGIEFTSGVNILGIAANNIEFKAGPIIGAHSRSKIEMTTTIFEAYANVLAEIFALVRAELRSVGKAVVNGYRKFAIESHGSGVIDAKAKLEIETHGPMDIKGHDIKINAKAELIMHSPKTSVGGGQAGLLMTGSDATFQVPGTFKINDSGLTLTSSELKILVKTVIDNASEFSGKATFKQKIDAPNFKADA